MFDLFRSRAKAVRIMLGAMLTIVALSMLVYLIPGAGTPVGNADDQVIAEIGKEPITVNQVDMQIRNLLQGAKVPPEMADSYVPQLIDQAIAARAMAYEAKRLGFEVTDADLAYIIRSTQYGSLPPDQYSQYVEQQLNTSVPEFENGLRENAYLEALQSLAVEGAIVTSAEVQAAYKQQNDKIKFEYVALVPEKIAAAVKPTDAELQAYFEKNKNFFPQVETRQAQLIVADQAKVGASIPISDAQIQNYYNSHLDQYRTPERVHARHILLATTGKSDAEKAQIKAKAEDLLKQLRAGGDFAALAQKNSEDPGSASKGGDLGWVVRGQMVKEFEDTTFALKPKEISNVITTQYGYHIIQVLEKEPAHLKALDEVKTQIADTLRSQSVFDKMQGLEDQARQELVKNPQNAQQISSELGLQFVDLPKYKAGDPIPELGTDQQVNTAIASLKKGEVSQVIQAGNKLAIAVVTNVVPPHPAQYSEVQAQVKINYTQQQGNTLVAEKQSKLLDLLKSNGGDLNAAAKSLGLEVKTADYFSRDGAAEGIGPAAALSDAFTKPDGTIIGPVPIAGQTVIGKVVGRQQADMTKLAEQRQTILMQIKTRKAQELAPLLMDSVLTRLVQEGKVKKHQDVINKLVARYHS
ncbi:MAG TPA: peptidyl-prolyl cis-trans isomerase [Bryobacteraceae bacterium]|nr:peptidyl-prolyl cis-trans isomerase [Bryobacteraceae bacterium]